MKTEWDVIVVGSGSAAHCAGLAALEAGRKVLMIEKADLDLAGGNSRYTAGAMRFVYDGNDDILPLIDDPSDPRLPATDFGAYTADMFASDLLRFNDGLPLSREQTILIAESRATMGWLASHGIRFSPMYSHQSHLKNGRYVFWGGLTLQTRREGSGLVEAQQAAFARLGGECRYRTAAVGLLDEDRRVVGVRTEAGDLRAPAVVLACGGFESDPDKRARFIGEGWQKARVRGTPHNTGQGLDMALALGARMHGTFGGCHAAPMDYFMPEYGNVDLPHIERKLYRKICYFLGIMVNVNGQRFVDEGLDFRNYTYAQYGRMVMQQPDHRAWQIFDSKVIDLLHLDYHFHDTHFVEDPTLDGLVTRLEGVRDKQALRETIESFNASVLRDVPFDPSIKDGRSTVGLALPKSNWALCIDQGPFRAYPVTGGITFTYGGVEVDDNGAVLHEDGHAITGLFAAGEMVGGLFFGGYPGGSGLTSGAVFGRRAGAGAARYSQR